MIAIEQQIAEKTCAIFERRNGAYSSRARDLADIASIAFQMDGIDGTKVVRALQHEVSRRFETLSRGLPPAFDLDDAQADEWRGRWTTLIRQPPMTFEDALLSSVRFLDPVLDERARGKRWSGTDSQWQ